MKQPVLGDLFTPPVIYPQSAGWKGTDTSRDAASSTDASTLRALVLTFLKTHGPHTADETASGLNIDKLAIRPRFTELKLLQQIQDTTWRRLNQSGKRAIVWGIR
jgi:hypothetical protein